jgi:hypothetical protein
VAGLAATLCLSGPASATDRFWVNDFGGTWDDSPTFWKDATGASGLPLAGDNAYLVLPYQTTVCPGGICNTQPVPVTYRSNTDPNLNYLVINSDNYLSQRELSFVSLAQLNLTSNYEILGSGMSFTPPPGTFVPTPPGIFPRGQHFQFAGTNAVKVELIIGQVQAAASLGANSIEGNYHLGGGTLTVGEPGVGGHGFERIGFEGDGRFLQSKVAEAPAAGTHIVHGTQILGERAGSSGLLDLRDGTLEVSSAQFVGWAGRGEVKHSGGSASVGNLILGLSTGSEGTYTLGSAATLTIAGETVIGAAGKGSFQQLLTALAVPGDLVIGRDVGGDGTYSTTGALTVGGKLVVGDFGKGSFVQGSQPVTVGGDLLIGRSEASSYALSGGELSVGGRAVVYSGGAFKHEGGLVTAQGDLELRWGSYRLAGGGELRVSPNVAIPVLFEPTLAVDDGSFEQLSGKVSIGNADFAEANFMLVVGGRNPAGYSLQDGELKVYGSVHVGPSGLSRGSFVQSGGTLDIGATRALNPVLNPAALYAGSLELTNGDYMLSGGEVIVRSVQGALEGGVWASQGGELKVLGTSTFTQSEALGRASVKASGITVSSLARYALSGGVVNVEWTYFPGQPGDSSQVPPIPTLPALYLGGDTIVSGTFLQSGGELHGRVLHVSSGGSYRMSGGLLRMTGGADPIASDFNAIKNEGSFVWQGGSIELRRFTGEFATFAVDSGGELTVQGGGVRTLNAGLRNDGLVTVQDTELRVRGIYSGNAPMTLDPSTVVFEAGATLGADAYFVGDAGSVFQMGADFVNGSEESTLWNTAAATLTFDGEGAVTHAFYLPGMDRGASAAGFIDNFAWGELGLAADDSLVLLDGNATSGAALYVSVIRQGTILGNVSSPYDLYYDPALSGNAWLAGATVQLSGGGLLTPVPEPRTYALMALGLILLVGVRLRSAGKT